MTYEYVKVSRDGHCTIVTIDRPEAHNALNSACHCELEEIFDEFAADEQQ